jgi:hypothetical protein
MKRKQKEPTRLEIVIDNVLDELSGFTADAPEFAAMTDQLRKLYELKGIDRENRRSLRTPSPDTLAIVAANLLGICVIVGYERANVITSKAVSFVLKSR